MLESARVFVDNAMNTDFIDMAEDVATKMDVLCSRTDNEITIKLKNGKFFLLAMVDSEHDLMTFICDLQLKVPKSKQASILKAISRVNERIWVGHFDFITAKECIVYNLTIPFLSYFTIDRQLVEFLYRTIADDCDKFYNYFLTIIHDKRKGSDALALQALFVDTCAEA